MLKSHRDLIVWQKGMELVKIIYRDTEQLPKSEAYGLSAQMRRAAISIPSNISEGQQRKNIKEFLQYLRIAFGSTAELDTQIRLAQNLYPKVQFSEGFNLIEEIGKMLNVLIRKLESKI